MTLKIQQLSRASQSNLGDEQPRDAPVTRNNDWQHFNMSAMLAELLNTTGQGQCCQAESKSQVSHASRLNSSEEAVDAEEAEYFDNRSSDRDVSEDSLRAAEGGYASSGNVKATTFQRQSKEVQVLYDPYGW